MNARFRALARSPEGTVRLAEAALWVAALEYPGLDVPACLGELDRLGGTAARRIAPGDPADAAAAALAALLAGEAGFRGNVDDYYDPRNSYLNDVLARRLGIPITLSVVYIDVGARAGVDVRGVGLPGHFVVRLIRHGTARLLDPFHDGRVVGEADCEALVRRARGPDARLAPADLETADTAAVVARMLRNLKATYTARTDWSRALRTAEALVALCPGTGGELRDRGIIRGKLGDARGAIGDLEGYLGATPDAADADAVRHALRALRQSLAVLN